MKKSLIAFAVLSAFATAASAQSSVVLYGVIDTSTSYMTNQNTTGAKKVSMDTNNLSSSRWGFKGSEDLGNGLKANFQLESSLSVDTGTAGSLFDRNATVGLSSASFGTLNAGRQTNLAYDTLTQVDPIGVAHVGTNPNIVLGSLNNVGLYGTHGSSNGFSSATRQNNSLKYSAPAVAGITFTGMYGFGEKTGDATAGSYAGAAATYSEGGLTAVLSYSQLRDAAANSSTLRVYTGGAKFAVNDELTIKVTYAENEVNTTTRNISVFGTGFDYKFSPTTTLTGGYYANHRSGDVKGKADLFVVLGKYAFSKRTAAYASVSYAKAGTTLAKDTDIGLIIGANNRSATRTVVGVNHSF